MEFPSPPDEFDEFLERAANSEDERLAGELRHLKIHDIIQDGLIRANYRSLEHDREYALRELEGYRTSARLLAATSEEGEVSEQQIELDALTAAEYRALTERFIITIAAMEVSRSLTAPRPHDAATARKKELFAELLVAEQLSRNRPLYVFLNDVLPGDPVDADSEDMLPYYATAMKTVTDYEKLKLRDEMIIQDSLIAAGVDDSGDVTRYSIAAHLIYRSSLGEKSDADREEAMYIAARQQRLEHQIAQKMIGYFMRLGQTD